MKTYTLFASDATVKALKAELCRYGKPVMPAYDSGSIKRNGVFDEVKTLFEETGTCVV